MEPWVSILTPCYNSEKYIGTYLDKILQQTYDNIELVIINDGSTDNTEHIIKSYQSKIKLRGYRLIYYKQKNKGLGAAINQGLKLMTGDFFCWCDSDNFYANEYVEKNIDVFLSSNCNIVRCDGYLYYDDDLEHPYHQFSKYNTDKFKKRLFLNAIVEKNFHFGCAMIRTSAFDMVCPDREIYPSRYGQNWQILLPVLYYYDAYYIDEPLFFFINRKDSISSSSHTRDKMLEMQNDHEKILLETIKKMQIKDAKYYEGIIREKYIKRRIWVAETYRDQELLEKSKKELSEFQKFCNRRKYFCLFPKYRKP